MDKVRGRDHAQPPTSQTPASAVSVVADQQTSTCHDLHSAVMQIWILKRGGGALGKGEDEELLLLPRNEELGGAIPEVHRLARGLCEEISVTSMFIC